MTSAEHLQRQVRMAQDGWRAASTLLDAVIDLAGRLDACEQLNEALDKNPGMSGVADWLTGIGKPMRTEDGFDLGALQALRKGSGY